MNCDYSGIKLPILVAQLFKNRNCEQRFLRNRVTSRGEPGREERNGSRREGRKEEDKCIFYIQIAVSNRKAGRGREGERERGRAPLAERIHNKFQMSALLETLLKVA